MRVNKNLLLQKSNEELEDYLKPNNGYVTDAIEYAVEILKDRGYEFSEGQRSYIEISLLPEEKKETHKDYIIASNFIFASATVGVVGFLYGAATFPDFSIFGSLFSLLIVTGFGLLARMGTVWVKYVLLVFSIIGFVAIPIMIFFYFTQPLICLVNFIQTILQTIAVVFLFKAPVEKPKWKDIFDPQS